MPTTRLVTLGGLTITPNAALQRRPLIVLAIMAATGQVGITRDKLISLVWPDREIDKARNLLDQALLAVRRAFGSEVVRTTATGLVYDALCLPCDVVEFDEAVRANDPTRAITCYTGAYLDGVTLPDAPEFEHWTDGQRSRRIREACVALEALARSAGARGDQPVAASLWERRLALDPLSSQATVELMRALGAAGELARALDVARVHAALIHEQLEAPPDVSVTALSEEMRRQRGPPTSAQATVRLPPVASGPPPAQAPPALPRRRSRISLVVATTLVAGVVAVFLTLQSSKHIGALTVPSAASIAVLPFANFTPTSADEYLSDGLTEELITALGKVPSLHVCARTSAWTFKNKPTDVRDIGRALGVASVLEGSVQRTANRLRVTVELIDTRAGYQLWGEQYDRTLDDVFKVEDEITHAVVGALAMRLTADEHAPADPDAYLLYLQGRYAWHERTAESLHRAVRDFELAIAKDPRYAPAYAGLADVYVVLPLYESTPAPIAYGDAIVSAQRALALDSTLAGPHATIGFARQRLYQWDSALAEYRRALAFNSNDATAHQWYGKALAERGDLVAGEAEVRRALSLDPLSAVTAYNLGQILFWRHRYTDAESALNAALGIRATFYQAHTVLGLIAAADGRARAAIAEFRQVVATERQREPDDLALLGYAYALVGARDTAITLLHEVLSDTALTPVSATDIATLYLGLGQRDSAFVWLERAVTQFDSDLEAFIPSPTFAPLAHDARFSRLRAEIHE
jgi:TolB-like protein/DNA-binding SARP family transcriptional activator